MKRIEMPATGSPAMIPGALTPREREILGLLAEGHYYREIGDTLHISMSTVRAHLHSVYKKLHVRSRTQAVCKFLKHEAEFLPAGNVGGTSIL